MKRNIFIIAILITSIEKLFCGGLTEQNLVNVQEIKLDGIGNINIEYSDDNIVLFQSSTDTLIIKEYMNKNSSKYYAKIEKLEDSINIKRGTRPINIFFGRFYSKIEIYLPSSMNKLNIKTTDGNIEASNNILCSEIFMETSDGKISLNGITASNITLKAKDGNIEANRIIGNIQAMTKDGRITLDRVTGLVAVKTGDGHINCTVTEDVGNITLETRDGRITLNLPQNLSFKFTARTKDGKLSTPFSEKLHIPLTDRHLTEGFIGIDSGAIDYRNIAIITGDGNIKINWI